MKTKKGDIWVSAILYFGLGIIIITILLTAGLPVINKLRDKNIAVQTKNSFQILDANIREVIRGGPGTQRVITLELKRGDFSVDNINSNVKWEFNSKAFLTEPVDECDITTDTGTWVAEGNVKVCTEKSSTKGSYVIKLNLDYNTVAKIDAPVSKISGVGDILVRNNGVDSNTDEIKIGISQI